MIYGTYVVFLIIGSTPCLLSLFRDELHFYCLKIEESGICMLHNTLQVVEWNLLKAIRLTHVDVRIIKDGSGLLLDDGSCPFCFFNHYGIKPLKILTV